MNIFILADDLYQQQKRRKIIQEIVDRKKWQVEKFLLLD
jgi:hypothetical protein